MARGAVESGRGHYPAMVVLHTGLLPAAWSRSGLADRPFVPALGWPMLALVLAAQGLRWWCIRTLGPRWNTQVHRRAGPAAGGRAAPTGCVLRHPNYVAVVVEGAALPLVHTAWLTALVFTVLNAALLACGYAARTPWRRAPWRRRTGGRRRDRRPDRGRGPGRAGHRDPRRAGRDGDGRRRARGTSRWTRRAAKGVMPSGVRRPGRAGGADRRAGRCAASATWTRVPQRRGAVPRRVRAGCAAHRAARRAGAAGAANWACKVVTGRVGRGAAGRRRGRRGRAARPLAGGRGRPALARCAPCSGWSLPDRGPRAGTGCGGTTAVAPWTDFVEVHWSRADGEAYVTPVADDLVGVAVLSARRRGYDEHLAASPRLLAACWRPAGDAGARRGPAAPAGARPGGGPGAAGRRRRRVRRRADRARASRSRWRPRGCGGLPAGRHARVYEGAWLRLSRRHRLLTGALGVTRAGGGASDRPGGRADAGAVHRGGTRPGVTRPCPA